MPEVIANFIYFGRLITLQNFWGECKCAEHADVREETAGVRELPFFSRFVFACGQNIYSVVLLNNEKVYILVQLLRFFMKGCCFTAERFFSAILVITVVLGVTWSVLLEPVVIAELLLASFLAVMGVLAVATINRATSGVMMPLFFIAAVVYNAYVYLIYVAEASSLSAYFMQPAGYLLMATSILSLVGLILGFAMCSLKKVSCSPAKMHEKTSARMAGNANKMKMPSKMASTRKKAKTAKNTAGKSSKKSRKASRSSRRRKK